ncbi:WD repeat domain phosphoinositide-interacting protein 1-like [Calypte anna]|uniref:WD repeat domain phosphoinositide-interacting protein 1-like n=1 Tax=Calypte anna TaxID=9244 RepID=UPI0011C40877|nr:WD repeat domain phosphoinositide-interacting protein 1-like [Calypte anna]
MRLALTRPRRLGGGRMDRGRKLLRRYGQRAGMNRTEPNRTEQRRAGPGRVGWGRSGPGRGGTSPAPHRRQRHRAGCGSRRRRGRSGPERAEPPEPPSPLHGGRGRGSGGPAELSCFSYNQDCTSLAIGTTTGYRLFSLSSVEQLDQVHESNEIPDVYIVERLFSSSLVVVVSHAKPQQMNVYHFKKGTEICNYSYSSNILSIRLNRQRLVVCLEESIYIHNIKDMKLLKTIVDTPPNTTGEPRKNAWKGEISSAGAL